MAYPTTDKQVIEKLKLAASIPNYYWNQFPFNLGYFHADGRTSFDCVNLIKAILNGWEYTKEVGYFVHDLSRTGDCTEWGLISQTPYTADFTKLNCLAVLYMQGHIGAALGETVVKNGHTYNVIECTGAWGGGVLYSYVDSAGRRYNHKGGSQNGRWEYWGKMTKWVTYGAKTYPATPFEVFVLISDLNLRSGAGTDYESKGFATKGSHIVTQVKNDFGYIGNGWIYLANSEYVKVGKHMESPFKDVAVTDPKYAHIKKLYDEGLINGYADGTFKPKEPITREDVCVILSKLLKKLGK
mgnify:CR=1 FL=1